MSGGLEAGAVSLYPVPVFTSFVTPGIFVVVRTLCL